MSLRYLVVPHVFQLYKKTHIICMLGQSVFWLRALWSHYYVDATANEIIPYNINLIQQTRRSVIHCAGACILTKNE